MSNEQIKLTREELYQKVWSKPATILAEELGISDVAIAKICKKLNIPKPYPGYWQQVNVGRGVHPPPLPGIQQGIPKDVVIYPNQFKPLQSQSPEVLAQIESERQAANHIGISPTLHNPHPLVSQAKQLLEKTKPNMYGLVRAPWNQKCLDVRVSRTEMNRALRILDALLKALVSRGYSAEIFKEGPDSTAFVIQGQRVKVSLVEKTDRKENELSETEKRNSYLAMRDRWIYIPNGKLSFIIHEYCPENCRKRWSDKIQKPLEDQLNEIMIGVIVAAEGLRQREIRFQEEQRKYEEAELRRRQESQRRKSLEAQSEAWSRIQNIRLFLQSCEGLISNTSGSIVTDCVEAKWLAWAHRYLDSLDPLKNGDFEKMIHQVAASFLGNRPQ
jgi:hypothetical protein